MRADSDALLQLVLYKSMESQLGEIEKKNVMRVQEGNDK